MANKTEHQVADAEQVLDLLKHLHKKGITVINFESADDGSQPMIFVQRTQELERYMMGKEVEKIDDDIIHMHIRYIHQSGCTIQWEEEELWQTRAWALYSSTDKPGVAQVAKLLKEESFDICPKKLIRFLHEKAL